MHIFCSYMYIIFSLFTLGVAAESSPKERLLNGVALFNKGQYGPALTQLKTIDVRKDLDNSDDMKLALKIRAIALNETGDTNGAIENIRELYFLDPSYRFDAFDTPSEVVALALHELKVIEEKNQQLALIKPSSPANLPDPSHPNEKIVLAPPKIPFATTLFPFGINHYLSNSPVKGSIYLSLQAFGLAANIGAYWWKQSYLDTFGTSRLENPANKGRFEAAQIIQYVALGVFTASLGASIIDALINYSNSSAQNEPLLEINL